MLSRNAVDSAQAEYKQLIAFFEQQGDRRLQIESLMGLADAFRNKMLYDSSLRYLRTAEDLGRKYLEHGNLLFADINHRIGTILIDKGHFVAARSYIDLAVEIRMESELEADSALAHSYNNLGHIFFYEGNYQQAKANYLKALEIALPKKKADDLALFFQNLGIIYASLGVYDSANYFLRSSLSISGQLPGTSEVRLGNRFMSLGRLMYLTGNTDSAMMYFNRAETHLAHQLGSDNPFIGHLALNKGSVYANKSDYEQALNLYNRALTIFNKNFESTHPNVLIALQNIGYIHEKKGDYSKAIEYYLRSIAPGQDIPSNVRAYRNLAYTYSLTKQDHEAEMFYRRSISLGEAIWDIYHPETILSITAYARYLLQKERVDESIRLLHKAERAQAQITSIDKRELSGICTLMGYAYLEKNDLVQAQRYANKAIGAITSDNEITPAAQQGIEQPLTPDQILLSAMLLKARVLKDLSYINQSDSLCMQSLETYRTCARLLHTLRTGYQGQESKLIISGKLTDVYLEGMSCALDLYDKYHKEEFLQQAFEFSEAGKAAVLTSSFRELEAKQVAGISKQLQDKERNLRQTLSSYSQLIYDEKLNEYPDKDKIAVWEKKLLELTNSYDTLLNTLDKNYPEYYQLRYGSEVVDIPAIQLQLKPDQALISYTLGEKLLFGFVITPDTAAYFRKNIDSTFLEDIDAFRSQLLTSDFSGFTANTFRVFEETGLNLYNALLAPAKSIIGNKNLIIIPDNELGYLPFDVLITRRSNSERNDFRALAYLIQEQSLSYSYSATLLFKHLKKTKALSRHVLAMAPEYGHTDVDAGMNNLRDNLIPLPWALDESKRITSRYKGRLFAREDATESKFKQKAARFNILHLAMHTIIDNENPLYSKLVFSPVADSTEDGMLNTFELFNLKLNAEMAVLSACKTGDGKLSTGEGIMSLARGFIYAGVPSVVMTLWEVDDYSSSELVTLFYKYLSEGYSKDKALQLAKIYYLQNSDMLKAHPHFWAGFINIGDAGKVGIARDLSREITYFALLLLSILSVYLIYRKTRKGK